MSGTNNEPNQGAGQSPNQQNVTQARVRPEGTDPGKLAVIIRDNRTKINGQWELLRKLDQMIASLDAKLEAESKKTPLPPPHPPLAGDQGSMLTNAA